MEERSVLWMFGLPVFTETIKRIIEIAKAKGMPKEDADGKPMFTWDDYEAMHAKR